MVRQGRQQLVGQDRAVTAEDDLGVVECLQTKGGDCVLEPACVLKGAFAEAVEAFLDTLDGYTLADLVKPQRRLSRLLDLPSPDAAPLTP